MHNREALERANRGWSAIGVESRQGNEGKH